MAQTKDLLDGTYQLRREIARTPNSVVYEAEHLVTRVRVAVKTLTRTAPPPAAARLVREARILGALRHPGVVAVYDAGTCPSHGPYLVLELIEGRSLDGILLARQVLPLGQAVAVVMQLCDALRAVHHHGVVHRDVKPSNLLIERTRAGDRVKLIDFGIAKLSNEPQDAPDKISQLGELLGTIAYMAPEQLIAGAPADARADIYGVGVVLFECLAGEPPYRGTTTDIISSMLEGTLPPAIRTRRDDVSLELEAAVRKALELDPNKRFSTIAELAYACMSAVGGQLPAIDLLDAREPQAAKPTLTAASPVADDAANRRRFARAPYVTPVRVVTPGGGTCDGRTEDLSEGGLLMVTDSGGDDASHVRIRLPLPLSGRVVELEASTKWVRSRRAQRAVGVEFRAAPNDVLAEIRKYVALMTGGAPAAPRIAG